ncbi:hypothetical protein Tco_0049756 [Tanacetum coccineum]
MGRTLVLLRRSAKKKKDKGKAIMIEDESVQKESKKQMYQALKKKPVTVAQASSSDLSQEKSTEESKELSKEDLKKMLEIVLVEKTKAEALQVKYPIVDWEV